MVGVFLRMLPRGESIIIQQMIQSHEHQHNQCKNERHQHVAHGKSPTYKLSRKLEINQQTANGASVGVGQWRNKYTTERRFGYNLDVDVTNLSDLPTRVTLDVGVIQEAKCIRVPRIFPLDHFEVLGCQHLCNHFVVASVSVFVSMIGFRVCRPNGWDRFILTPLATPFQSLVEVHMCGDSDACVINHKSHSHCWEAETYVATQ
jgi:hypothetical protein